MRWWSVAWTAGAPNGSPDAGLGLAAEGHLVTVICLDGAGAQGPAAARGGHPRLRIGFRGLSRSVLLDPFPLILRFRRAIEEASLMSCIASCTGRTCSGAYRAQRRRAGRGQLTPEPQRRRHGASAADPVERVCDQLAHAVVCNSNAVLEDAVRQPGCPGARPS